MHEITKILPTKQNPRLKTNIGDQTMKTFITSLAAAVIISGFFSCKSTNQTSSVYTDDVYYSSKNKERSSNDTPGRNPSAPATIPDRQPSSFDELPQNNADQPEYTEQSEPVYYDENFSENGTVVNNYYGDYNDYSADDYYDYAYSSRIRRFHNPAGFGYYDPFYTNMYYYNYDPFCWGSSIYMSYGFWNPSPWGWGGWGINYGWGGYGWGGGYYGWGGYNTGYINGYNHGYWNGYSNGLADNYYYNSYDRSSHHYGPRTSSAGAGSAGNIKSQRSLAQTYQSAVSHEKTDVPRGNISSVNAAKPAERNAGTTNAGKGTVSSNDSRSAKSRELAQPVSGDNERPNAAVQKSDASTRRSSAEGRLETENNVNIQPQTNQQRSTANVKPQTSKTRANTNILPQHKPAVKPAPAGRTTNNGGRQTGYTHERNNIYHSPKRNPNTYQPHTPPNMNSNRERPSYNRTPSQQSGRINKEQNPSYNYGGNHSRGYSRESSRPSYSQPSRSYTPDNAQPSRKPVYSQPEPSRNSGYSRPEPSRNSGYSRPEPSRSPSYSQPSPSRSSGHSNPSRDGGSMSSPRSGGTSGRTPR